MAKLNRRKSEFQARKEFFRKRETTLEVAEVASVFKKFVNDVTAKNYLFTLSYVNFNALDKDLFGHMGVVSNIPMEVEGALEAYIQLIASSLVRMSVELKMSPDELLGKVGTKIADFEESLFQ